MERKIRGQQEISKILKFDPKFPCGRALEKMGAKPGDTGNTNCGRVNPALIITAYSAFPPIAKAHTRYPRFRILDNTA